MSNFGLIEQYRDKMEQILGAIVLQEKDNIDRTVNCLADTIEQGKLVHIFGTGGHSVMAAMEIFYRAGGLVQINPIFPPGVSVAASYPNTERITGYAKLILDYYGVKQNDVIIISNVNGINALTIDSALESKKRGATVIAVTSRDFASNVPHGIAARHPSNKNLHELGDIVLDLHVPVGDAVVEIPNFEQRVASSSTIAICFLLNSIVALVVEELLSRGVTPPVWKSANVAGGDEANKKYIGEYKQLIHHLY